MHGHETLQMKQHFPVFNGNAESKKLSGGNTPGPPFREGGEGTGGGKGRGDYIRGSHALREIGAVQQLRNANFCRF